MQINQTVLDKAMRKNLAAKGSPISGGKFTGTAPIKDLVILQTGDIIQIPVNATPVNVPIRGRKNEDGSQMTFEAVYAQLERNGVQMAIAITPSVFSRSAAIVDKDTLQDTGVRAESKGTAVDTFWQKVDDGEDLDTAMKALYGKDIKVSAVNKEWTFNESFMRKPQQRSFFTLDFVTP